MQPNQTPTLTEREAQAQGYTYCIAQGDDRLQTIGDTDADLSTEVIFVCKKEPINPSIDGEGVFDLIKEHFENHEDFSGDDGTISDLLGHIPDAIYQSFADIINEALSGVDFYQSAGIRLVPEPDDETDE